MNLPTPPAAESRPWRGTTFWSLALNIFLVCGIAAFAADSWFPKAAHHGKGGPAYHFEMLASRLPLADAKVLLTEFGERSSAIEEAHTATHRSRDNVRLALRAEPYDDGAAREAMSQAQAAHLRLEKLLQDAIASAAARMTPAGRARLADWQAERRRR